MEGLGQRLGHEGKLRLCPNLRVGLERLLDVHVERASLEGNNLGGSIRVVGDGRAAGWAKDAVDSLSRGTLSGPGLGFAVDLELVLWNDGDEGCFVVRESVSGLCEGTVIWNGLGRKWK